jgi:hypothetical protein
LKHLVLGGLGQVGSALVELLRCDWSDAEHESIRAGRPDVLHVAIPYAKDVAGSVHMARDRFDPAHVVVHSTVPVGTCDALGAIHSPVRGVHPHMLAGLRTFVKFFGGPHAAEVAQLFADRGVRTRVLADARTCEALKLWDTAQYGLQLRLMQEMHRWCADNGVPFNEVYGFANATYNSGYTALGRPEVCRPFLRYAGPGIGGHCVLPNLDLLDGTPVCDVVRNGFQPR